MRQFFPIVVLLLLFCYSCEKEVIDNTDKNFPIELRPENSGSLNSLTWTETNISTFNEYIIVRSFDSIPAGLMPSSNVIVGRIDDFTENTFIDNSAPFERELYYKVYVDIGERFLESPSLKLVQNVLTYDFIAEKILYDSKQDVFFLFQLSLGTLSRFDVSTGVVTHSITGISNFRDFMVGDNGGTRELYISSRSNGLISILNAENLSLIDEFTVGREVYSMANNNRGLLFLSTDYDVDQLRIYRRSDFLQRGSVNNSIASSERRLLMLNEATNELIEATSFQLFYYKIAEDGSFIEMQTNNNVNGVLLDKIPVSPDKENFIPYRDGRTFDANLNIEFLPNSLSSSVSSFAFNDAGDRVVAGFSFFGFIQPFSFPSFNPGEFTDISLNSVQRLEPLGKDGIIYVLGLREVGFETNSFIRPLQF